MASREELLLLIKQTADVQGATQTTAALAKVRASAQEAEASSSNIQQGYALLANLPVPVVPALPPGSLVNPDRQGSSTPARSGTTITGQVNNIYITTPSTDPQAIAREVLAALEHAADSAPQAAPVGLAGAIG